MSSNDRFKAAHLKIDRALEHITDVNNMLSERRPFRYILETDAKTGRRSLYAERDGAVINALSLRCGDAIQNLRDGLDYAYAAVVSTHASTPRETRSIQFPFSETEARLEEACRNRLAHKVGQNFLDAIMRLKPHGGTGGNQILYFMSTLNNKGKHVTLIPIGYYVALAAGEIRKQIPDFLPGVDPTYQINCGQNNIDVKWFIRPFTMNDWIINGVPANGILKREIDVPINVCFIGTVNGREMLTVPTLHQFVDVAKHVVAVIARFG